MQCDTPFEFTPAEQEYFLERGFDFPKRCPQCRKKKSKAPTSSREGENHDKKKHYRLKYDDE